MSLTSSLFNLVKSLSATEKANFKKFGFKGYAGTQEMYSELFDFIDKQKVYDEAKLKASITHKKLLTNFSASKSFLYDSILSFLVSQNMQDPTIELLDNIQYAQILKERALYEEALSYLIKAEAVCVKNHFYGIMYIYVLKHQIAILKERAIDKDVLKEKEMLYIKYLDNLNIDLELERLLNNLDKIRTRIGQYAITDRDKNLVSELLKADVLKRDLQESSAKVRFYQMKLRLGLNNLLQNIEGIEAALNDFDAFWENEKGHIESRKIPYLGHILNQMEFQIQKNDWETFKKKNTFFLSRMKQMGTESVEALNQNLYVDYFSVMLKAKLNFDWKNAKQDLDEYIKLIGSIGVQMPVIVFYNTLQILSLLIKNNQDNEVIDLVLILQTNPVFKQNEFYDIFLKIFQAMALIDLKDEETAHTILQNIKRTKSYKEAGTSDIATYINYLVKMTSTAHYERKKIVAEFLQYLEENKDENQEVKFFSTYFYEWISKGL